MTGYTYPERAVFEEIAIRVAETLSEGLPSGARPPVAAPRRPRHAWRAARCGWHVAPRPATRASCRTTFRYVIPDMRRAEGCEAPESRRKRSYVSSRGAAVTTTCCGYGPVSHPHDVLHWCDSVVLSVLVMPFRHPLGTGAAGEAGDGAVGGEGGQVVRLDVQAQDRGARPGGQRGVAVVGVDDDDVARLELVDAPRRAQLQGAGDDDEQFQGRVPVVVVGADRVDVLAGAQAAGGRLVDPVELVRAGLRRLLGRPCRPSRPCWPPRLCRLPRLRIAFHRIMVGGGRVRPSPGESIGVVPGFVSGGIGVSSSRGASLGVVAIPTGSLASKVPPAREIDARRGGAAVREIAGVPAMVAVRPATALLEGPRRRRLSKSVAKARIAPGRAKRNVDILRFLSPPIPSRSAFAADLDTHPPRAVPGAPRAPPRPASGLLRHHAAPRPRPGGQMCAPEHVHGAGRLRPRPGGQPAGVVYTPLPGADYSARRRIHGL